MSLMEELVKNVQLFINREISTSMSTTQFLLYSYRENYSDTIIVQSFRFSRLSIKIIYTHTPHNKKKMCHNGLEIDAHKRKHDKAKN